MIERGKFIVIDGVEGTGKSGIIQFLEQNLENKPVVFTREPGGTELAEEIRGVLLKKRAEHAEKFFAETELMLVSAGRFQHVRNFIIPRLEEGKHVISDRFSLATIAHQLYGNNRLDLMGLFEALDAVAVGQCVPDLYILLDVDVEIGLARRKAAEGMNRLDEKPVAYHEAVRTGFLEHLPKRGYPSIATINASHAEAQVKQMVLARVKECLNI